MSNDDDQVTLAVDDIHTGKKRLSLGINTPIQDYTTGMINNSFLISNININLGSKYCT